MTFPAILGAMETTLASTKASSVLSRVHPRPSSDAARPKTAGRTIIDAIISLRRLGGVNSSADAAFRADAELSPVGGDAGSGGLAVIVRCEEGEEFGKGAS
jgi:hypothetical protein